MRFTFFLLYENIISVKFAYFSTISYHTPLQDPEGGVGLNVSSLCMSAWNSDFGVDVASDLLTLMPHFVEIYQLTDIMVEGI
jgi:hypothetical protein